ncbi:hypothetical protein [Capillimicrobium parvum]|uniref:Uncharacterized protein n=1 Tax=Capillimicrobium parvum TaxID=2884022 RepID=A0A9E6Y1L7_9ACTN|nr:hypothetical protein [Capillimicrobium parvum]UGS38088.1 hypothetical protein DSM104329_04510 [Capillimicrobium parvum]
MLALACLTAAATAAAAAGVPGSAAATGGPPRAIVAFVPGATLDTFAAVPGASVGMLGATQGSYRQIQALLDLSQGARTSLAAYEPPRTPPLGVLADGRVAGWDAAVRRADAAPAPIVPGLFASSVPGGIAYVTQPGASTDPAIAVADRRGRVAVMALALTSGDVVARTRALLRRHRVAAVRLPDGAALRPLVRDRPPRTLVVAMTEPPATLVTRLLPVALVGERRGRTLTSRTTRTEGLVAGIDIAPTVLEWLGEPVPGEMTGQRIETAGPLDVAGLRDLHARLRVVTSRRYATLGYLALAWAVVALLAVAAGRRRGWRWAVRVGALAVLWLLPLLLPFAALRPGRLPEELGVALGALALAALLDRLVRWPVAPVVPAVIGIVAYVVDLAFGSPLIVTSLLGPNPLYGSRFYGIGNELESTLPVLMFTGIAAGACVLGRARRSPGLAVAFAAGGLVLGVAIGSGRLGADVGGVVTVGAGAAVAVLLALPGALTWRRALITVLVPVLAVVALAVLDLATGGDSHFTRSVLRAGDDQALEDVVQRRYELAWTQLKHGIMPLLTVIALGAIAAGAWARERLLPGVPGVDAWRAALGGSAAAGVAGALSNDSGPLLLVMATFGTAWVWGYLRCAPSSVRCRPTL